MSWTTADIPDQRGRVAVVTGANGGLGLETAKALAGAGAHVVMAARDQAKAATAQESIRASHPSGSTEVIELDLGSLDSVASAAEAILDGHPKVHLLVNNAGVMGTPEGRTRDGFETQFGVNHLGHWALTARLMPALVAFGPSRVVTVTSFARLGGDPIDPSNLGLEGIYEPWAAYNRSKLANFQFAHGLQADLAARSLPVTSLVAHPGLSHTELQVRTVDQGATGRSGEMWKWLAANVGMSSAEGALPQLRAATDPDVDPSRIYAPRLGIFGSPVPKRILRRRGLDEAVAVLWEVSERETGIGLFDRLTAV
jgi:NAD(P)-dependent dehydrogenase (short-subunit alcohol dehydrogenase family)